MRNHQLAVVVAAVVALGTLPLGPLAAQKAPVLPSVPATRVPVATPTRAADVVAAARPAAPAHLLVQTGGYREAILIWDLVPGVTQYRVYGPAPVPAAGVVVSSPIGGTPMYRANGLATGTNTFKVSSEYLGVANTPGLPTASILILPFTPPTASIDVELASNTVSVGFLYTTTEPLTFKLYRDDGRSGAKTEVTANLLWNRAPGSLPGTTRVSAKSFEVDLTPDRSYQYQLVAISAAGDVYRGPVMPVSVPQFIVRSTIPLAGDRVVIEWNPFGTAPYQVKKGMVTARPGAGGALLMDFVRDASGNPMNFTGARFDDTVVQRGNTYTYMVCARIPLGNACPGVEVRVPSAP